MPKNVKTGIGAAFRDRYLDVVASIYIYNEHRGYTALDRVLEAVHACYPDDTAFIQAITKHRADERKHYEMFRRWFERRGRMPLAVDQSYGHIDHFISKVFGRTIDDLDTAEMVADKSTLEKLFRVIILTEERGFTQVEVLLKNRVILSDPILTRIFQIIHKDEPDHFEPYRRRLESRGRPVTLANERFADWCIHKLLMLVKLPVLFLDSSSPRLKEWPDAGETASV